MARFLPFMALARLLASCGDDGMGADAAGGGDSAMTADGALITDAGPPGPDAAPPGALRGTFQLTYYWVTTEAEFMGTADTTIYDSSCGALATIPAAFAASLTLEGTGRLNDGRMLNYDGACGCAYSPCFFVLDAAHPWGVGVQNRALAPFRSIAVDTARIAIGTHLYVEQLDGVLVPGEAPWGGFVHDGCVVADDVGGGINGLHIDFFVALRAYYVTLDGQLGLENVTVYDGGARCP